jgi:hypothetical protein
VILGLGIAGSTASEAVALEVVRTRTT